MRRGKGGQPLCNHLPERIRGVEVDLVFLIVEEMEFGEMVIGVGADADLLFVLPAPVPLTAAEAQKTALCKIGVHDGVHGETEVFMLMIEQVAKVLFDLILQYQR